MQDRWISDWEPTERRPHYTRSTAGEVQTMPANPLDQQMCWDRGICLRWRDGYVRQGSYGPEEWDPVLPEINAERVEMIALRAKRPDLVAATDDELLTRASCSLTAATMKIGEGATIEVDGDIGVVAIVEVSV